MLSYILGVKIYIDTHRLNELCDTEGATKYPLGYPWAPSVRQTPRLEEVGGLPPGQPGVHT